MHKFKNKEQAHNYLSNIIYSLALYIHIRKSIIIFFSFIHTYQEKYNYKLLEGYQT